jgi:hypothetical protein
LNNSVKNLARTQYKSVIQLEKVRERFISCSSKQIYKVKAIVHALESVGRIWIMSSS